MPVSHLTLKIAYNINFLRKSAKNLEELFTVKEAMLNMDTSKQSNSTP